MRLLRTAPAAALRGTALVRIDANTTDTWRLDAVLPTLTLLSKRADRVIIISHRGRPHPHRFDRTLSLERDAQYLATALGTDVWFITDRSLSAVRTELDRLPRQCVVMLENIRAFTGEMPGTKTFARQLAILGTYFVQEAFPVLHHRAASVDLLPKYLPSYAGLQLEQECLGLDKASRRAQRPYVVVIGGAKAVDKLGVLAQCIDRADWVLVGGASANALLKLRGVDVQQSIYEHDPKLLKQLKPYVNHPKVMVPTDWKMRDGKILDIGPHTQRAYAQKIASARTILWTGPLGMIERPAYQDGSRAIARAIRRNKRAFSVTGGGETVSFLKSEGLLSGFRFVSTGGGAMVDYLAGSVLPGIAALETTAPTASSTATSAQLRQINTESLRGEVYDVFFHDDLDGRASTAVLLHFLTQRGARIERYVPVDYQYKDEWHKQDVLARIAGVPKINKAIIVDFLYHPSATMWFDHHTTTFIKQTWEHTFKPSPYRQLDTTYLSACHLVMDTLHEQHGYRPPQHIVELATAADIVDGARYTSAHQALALREPILQVTAYIDEQSSISKGSDPLQPLIELLATKGVGAAARRPEVRAAVANARTEYKRLLGVYRSRMRIRGAVTIIDLEGVQGRYLRYASYYLYPTTLYAIAIQHLDNGQVRLRVGANPWQRQRNPLHIGNVLRPYYNGGGHKDVGAVQLPHLTAALDLVEFLVGSFNNAVS